MLDLSIIIVNYRGWKYLESCIVVLESFSNTLFTVEVIIVDNCSNDGKLEQFQKRFSNFRFILRASMPYYCILLLFLML
jgi:GT2 family glycosyltransferase